jgi:hypothetical protein
VGWGAVVCVTVSLEEPLDALRLELLVLYSTLALLSEDADLDEPLPPLLVQEKVANNMNANTNIFFIVSSN